MSENCSRANILSIVATSFLKNKGIIIELLMNNNLNFLEKKEKTLSIEDLRISLATLDKLITYFIVNAPLISPNTNRHLFAEMLKNNKFKNLMNSKKNIYEVNKKGLFITEFEKVDYSFIIEFENIIIDNFKKNALCLMKRSPQIKVLLKRYKIYQQDLKVANERNRKKIFNLLINLYIQNYDDLRILKFFTAINEEMKEYINVFYNGKKYDKEKIQEITIRAFEKDWTYILQKYNQCKNISTNFSHNDNKN